MRCLRMGSLFRRALPSTAGFGLWRAIISRVPPAAAIVRVTQNRCPIFNNRYYKKPVGNVKLGFANRALGAVPFFPVFRKKVPGTIAQSSANRTKIRYDRVIDAWMSSYFPVRLKGVWAECAIRSISRMQSCPHRSRIPLLPAGRPRLGKDKATRTIVPPTVVSTGLPASKAAPA